MAHGWVGVTTRDRPRAVTWLPAPPIGPGRVAGAYDVDGRPIIHLAGAGLEQWAVNLPRAQVIRRVIDPTPQDPARMNEQLIEPSYRYLYAIGGGRGRRPTAGCSSSTTSQPVFARAA